MEQARKDEYASLQIIRTLDKFRQTIVAPSGCAASRDRTFDLVYQSLHFGGVLPGEIYYQLIESEILHPDGEL